jgi:elongation factor G
MLLSGMGELHLEIARDRLVNDFKAKATMGNIEISYRECVIGSRTASHRIVFDREIAGKKGRAGCAASIEPLNDLSPDTESTVKLDGNLITIDLPESLYNEEGVAILPQELSFINLRTALVNGAKAALARGPRRGFPLHTTRITLTFDPANDYFGNDSSAAALSSAARLAVQAALKEALENGNVGLMEPVMNVVISCDEASLGAIVHDLSSARGGHVLSLDNDTNEESASNLPAIDTNRIYAPPDPFASSSGADRAGPGQQRQVTARVPLKEMVGYLKHLRSLTGGRGTFIMSVDRFERLSGPREKAL